jgi:hypothetical protein
VTPDIVIERGSILIYRMFDVAESIDLAGLETRARAAAGTSRLRIARPGGQALIIRNAPVAVFLGDQHLAVGGTSHRCEVQARVWDYGVISFQFRIAVEALPWSALVAMAADIETSSNFEQPARQRLDELLAVIIPAVHGRHHWAGTEDYVVYFLEEVRGVRDASELLERADIPALLLGEAGNPLAARTRRSITEQWYQYWSHDLAVIDWNSALVVEPSGVRDVPDIIEFALTHLVEFRYYDDLLDEKLAKLYAAIAKSERRPFRANYERRAREASALFIDLTEFIERVDNSLKVIGDFYLATIFRASVNRLRVHEWQANVTRKLQLLARVSELLSAQASSRRSYSLEWVVVLLIAFEIIWALAGH